MKTSIRIGSEPASPGRAISTQTSLLALSSASSGRVERHHAPAVGRCGGRHRRQRAVGGDERRQDLAVHRGAGRAAQGALEAPGGQPGRPGLRQALVAGHLAAVPVGREDHAGPFGRGGPAGARHLAHPLLGPHRDLFLEGAGGVPVEVVEEEAGQQVGGHGQHHQGHGDRQHPDQEVGEGEAPADLPEERLEEPPGPPQQRERQPAGEHRDQQRREVGDVLVGEDHRREERGGEQEPLDEAWGA